MNKLHSGARWQFRFNAYIVMIFLSLLIGWFVIPALGALFPFIIYVATNLSSTTIILAIFVYLIFILIVGEIYARMSYNRWLYEFTDDGLRLERGIIWKRYSNIPYERIQNVDIHRGVLARMLGFSALMIQTAGYSGQPHSEGYIPALETNLAEQIRSHIMKKITRRK